MVQPSGSAHDEEPLHGDGAWKVAYADFVTALMALFIVLWLLSASREVRNAIGHYFRDPNGTGGTGVPVGGNGKMQGGGQGGTGASLPVNKDNVHELKDRLQGAMREIPSFENFQKFVQFTVSDEGLRVELVESEGGMFFDTASPQPLERGESLFRVLAQEMGKLPNELAIEGHTDSRAFRSNSPTAYSNWELSFDRANAARHIMLTNGLRPDQVAEIRGYADRRRLVDDPNDSRNRRVSVVVKFRAP